MPLPAGNAALQTTCETLISTLAGVLASKMPAFVAAKGWYFQGIQTPAVVPVNGLQTTPDLTLKPYYQADDWAAFGPGFGAKIPCSVAIDNYHGPKGRDWAIRVLVNVAGGQIWQKQVAGLKTEAQDIDWTRIL